jgi:malate dehydrogenase
LFVGVPVKLGREGVRQIIELSLTKEESAALKNSAAAVQDLVDAMTRLAAETAPGA